MLGWWWCYQRSWSHKSRHKSYHYFWHTKGKRGRSCLWYPWKTHHGPTHSSWWWLAWIFFHVKTLSLFLSLKNTTVNLLLLLFLLGIIFIVENKKMGGKDSSCNRFRFGVDLQLKNWRNSLEHLLPKGSLHFGGSESSKMLYVRQDCRGALTFDNSGKKTSSFVKIILVFLCVHM